MDGRTDIGMPLYARLSKVISTFLELYVYDVHAKIFFLGHGN